MDHKAAFEILKNILNKYPLNEEEKDAVNAAMGVLSWTMLGESKLKARKEDQRSRIKDRKHG